MRPSHTEQSQGSKLSQFKWNPGGRKTKSTVEVGDPTGTPPKKYILTLAARIQSNKIL